jgi:hypothetical protein
MGNRRGDVHGVGSAPIHVSVWPSACPLACCSLTADSGSRSSCRTRYMRYNRSVAQSINAVCLAETNILVNVQTQAHQNALVLFLPPVISSRSKYSPLPPISGSLFSLPSAPSSSSSFSSRVRTSSANHPPRSGGISCICTLGAPLRYRSFSLIVTRIRSRLWRVLRFWIWPVRGGSRARKTGSSCSTATRRVVSHQPGRPSRKSSISRRWIGDTLLLRARVMAAQRT